VSGRGHVKKRPAFEPAERLLQPTGYDPEMKRPATIVAGTLLIVLGVIAGIVWVISSAVVWPEWIGEAAALVGGDDVPRRVESSAFLAFAAVTGVLLAIEAALAIFVFAGRNWARVFVMVIATLTICSAFARWWVEGELEVNTTIVSLGIDILILLALSSRSAAAYARRNQRR
jgi:hypothetical protein